MSEIPFGRPRQRGIACLLAAWCALGIGVDLAGASFDEVHALFGDLHGAAYLAAEVLCSLPARDEALYTLFVAVLLYRPFCGLFGARGARLRRAGGAAAWVIGGLLSGYRAFSRVFARTFPGVSRGFQLECEVSIHAVDMGWRIAEVPIAYRDRPEGSSSKLSTVSDGLRVLMAIGALFKDCRPFKFFALVASVFLLFGLVVGMPVVAEFSATGFVSKLPSAVLAVGLVFCGALSLCTGLILDTVAKNRRKQWELEVYRIEDEARRSG